MSCSCFSVLILLTFHLSVDVTIGLLFRSGIALIVQLLTTAKSHLHLDVRAFEIQLQRHQRIALLRHKAEQFEDLLFVHEQAAGAKRIAVEDIAVLVGADVHLTHKQFPVVDGAVGILEIDRAGTQALDLGAEQLNARLIAFLYKIFMPRLFVLRDDLSTCFLFHRLTVPRYCASPCPE